MVGISSKRMTSRERMLAALDFKEPDYIPCSFMIFTALKERCADEFEFVEKELELGLDAHLSLGDLPIRFAPEVSIREWKEHPPGKERPILHKEYATPAGKLTAITRQTQDWPYHDHIPLFDDYLAPRSLKFLITGPQDLPALRSLLAAPEDEDIRDFREAALGAKRFARDKGLLLAGGWSSGPRPDETSIIGSDPGTMGIDALMWLSGPVNPLYWAYDQPDFLEELIDIIALWNRRRMEVILDVGVDLLIKRAWYEGCDFWSPALYRKFIAPVLKEDIKLTHQAGARFGYIITSGIMPLLDDFLELGIDVIIGIDPVQGKGTDLRLLQETLGGKICLWGGVNGFITIERGRPEEIKKAVKEAIEALASGGGFILSPVDNVRDTSDGTWQNVLTFIDAWKEFRKP